MFKALTVSITALNIVHGPNIAAIVLKRLFRSRSPFAFDILGRLCRAYAGELEAVIGLLM